jgi:hypothetical protein
MSDEWKKVSPEAYLKTPLDNLNDYIREKKWEKALRCTADIATYVTYIQNPNQDVDKLWGDFSNCVDNLRETIDLILEFTLVLTKNMENASKLEKDDIETAFCCIGESNNAAINNILELASNAAMFLSKLFEIRAQIEAMEKE